MQEDLVYMNIRAPMATCKALPGTHLETSHHWLKKKQTWRWIFINIVCAGAVQLFVPFAELYGISKEGGKGSLVSFASRSSHWLICEFWQEPSAAAGNCTVPEHWVQQWRPPAALQPLIQGRLELLCGRRPNISIFDLSTQTLLSVGNLILSWKETAGRWGSFTTLSIMDIFKR